MEITPEMARAWLAGQPGWAAEAGWHQPDEGYVARIAADIAAGRWQPGRGHPITLDEAGIVHKGMHRLLAIAAGDITVTEAVTRLPGTGRPDLGPGRTDAPWPPPRYAPARSRAAEQASRVQPGR